MERRAKRFWVCAGLLIFLMIPGRCGATLYYYGQTYDLAIPGPDAGGAEYGKGAMQTAELVVPDHRHIAGLEIYICLRHESLADLQITLTSPAGTKVILMRSGNSALLDTPGELFLGFADRAQTAVEDATQAAVPQLFKPAAGYSMMKFKREDPFGTWKLDITDQIYYSIGTLDNVRLVVDNPEPASVGFLMLGMGFLRRFGTGAEKSEKVKSKRLNKIGQKAYT